MGSDAARPPDGPEPVSDAERSIALDAIRGLALLGVLLVNLHGCFRVSLATHILGIHGSPTWLDEATDVVIAAVLEFKAFTLFSLLFGAGLAVFTGRAAARGTSPTRLLARRLLILLVMGLVHLLLVWNGDILTLYAVCGFLLLPLRRFSTGALAVAGVIAFSLPYLVPWGIGWPSSDTLMELAEEAARVYEKGSFGTVVAFHWHETRLLILPLLVAVLPKTLGLMAFGAAAWKAGFFREPSRHGWLLWTVAVVGGGVGATATALAVRAASTGQSLGPLSPLVEASSSAPLALAYAAGLLLALRHRWTTRWAVPFAAVGQMALTNYLTQSVVLSVLFYGYGLGLYGHIESLGGAGLGLVIYAAQVVFSLAWLRWYRFGPVEWLWRSLTYGRWQPMRREAAIPLGTGPERG